MLKIHPKARVSTKSSRGGVKVIAGKAEVITGKSKSETPPVRPKTSYPTQYRPDGPIDIRSARSTTQATRARSRGAVVSKGGAVVSKGGVVVRSNDRGRSRIMGPTVARMLHPLLPDIDPSEVKVSIVLGTYNRLKLLRACVGSIRKAATGLRYEIIVCDGGSTDGSVQWLQRQSDVVYLAGDLSGAVGAFNNAARRAQGEFILALNDDATLERTAIAKGLAHFKDPLVGQVALSFFEHDSWKLETVHQQTYANFALTRTNIVRAVEAIVGGMWATCYRTYGGDTELSCWVYRLGYRVVGATDARVVHKEYVDALRRKNLQLDRQRHQFNVRWPRREYLSFRGPIPYLSDPEIQKLDKIQKGETHQQRWPRIIDADPPRGLFSPRAVPKPERVLHWQLWTADDPQTSMVAALAKLGAAGHVCTEWTKLGAADRGRVFVETAKALRPTIIFLQCQDPDAVPVDALREIRQDPDRDPSLVVCVWSGDIGPGKGPWRNSKDDWQYAIANEVDLMLFTGTGQVEHHRARGMPNAAYLQIGYDVDRYFPGQANDATGVIFLGQDYGPQFDGVPGSEAQLRRNAIQAMRVVPGFVPYGAGFGKGIPQAISGDLYRSSSMALSISLTSSLGRYTSDRLLRSMACGCPTLVKRFEDMEGMGLVDAVNCLIWDNTEELVSTAREWLTSRHRSKLRNIGQRGATLMTDHHTWDVRMEELAAIVATARKQG